MSSLVLNRRDTATPPRVGFLPYRPWEHFELAVTPTIPGTVSFIIPAYNAARTLGEALMSCAWQTHPADEIVVVDDASTDTTGMAAMLFAQGHGGVTVARHDVNRGAAATRNHALRLASGEFVFYLDADDLAPPDRVALTLQEFAETGADVVYGQKEFFTRDWETRRQGNRTTAPTPQNIVGGTGFSTAAVAVRRDVHVEQGVWLDESMSVAEDAEMLVACLSRGVKVQCSRNVVCWRRERKDSLTSRGDWSLMRRWIVAKHREWLAGYMGRPVGMAEAEEAGIRALRVGDGRRLLVLAAWVESVSRASEGDHGR